MYCNRFGNILKQGTRWSRPILATQGCSPEGRRMGSSLQSLAEDQGDSKGSWSAWTHYKWVAPIAGMAGVLGFSMWYRDEMTLDDRTSSDSTAVVSPQQPVDAMDDDGLPEFSLDEISKHKTAADGIWVTHGRNVYDITEFVEGHPGGEKIMLAAGGPIEPFWNIYTIHKTPEVKEILDTMLIGKVKKSEATLRVALPEPYKNEPKRHPAFILNSQAPFDAETPPKMLVDHFLTPNDIFYVRNHLPVPLIEEKDYKLNVEMPGLENGKFTLEDLKTKFKKTKIVATMQCAGNRRKEMNQHKKIFGANGGHTAISNAEWGGVLLRDLLLSLGFDENDAKIKHIQFEGYDKDISGEHYGASVPVDIAMRSGGDVLLAYEMNGEELPRDHGYPLRVVIPGVVGARSVKWLKAIKASGAESPSFFQMKDYRTTPPSAKWNSFDFQRDEAHAIYSSPVQSAICSPHDGATVDADDEVLRVRGYAYSGGGNGILRVDVSIDGGETWQSADLLPGIEHQHHKNWAWTLWEAAIPLPSDLTAGNVTVCCKATDTFHNVQPENISGIWNLRGFLNNSWHRVTVDIKDNNDVM